MALKLGDQGRGGRICTECQSIIDAIPHKPTQQSSQRFNPAFRSTDPHISGCSLCAFLKEACLSMGYSILDSNLGTCVSYDQHQEDYGILQIDHPHKEDEPYYSTRCSIRSLTCMFLCSDFNSFSP